MAEVECIGGKTTVAYGTDISSGLNANDSILRNSYNDGEPITFSEGTDFQNASLIKPATQSGTYSCTVAQNKTGNRTYSAKLDNCNTSDSLPIKVNLN
jgi:hypothetical protein